MKLASSRKVKYWPLLASGITLTVGIATSFWAVAKGHPPAPPGSEPLWKLISDSLVAIGAANILFALPLASISLSLAKVQSNVETLSDEVERRMGEVPEVFEKKNEALADLLHHIELARERIQFMYLRDRHSTDPVSLDYWAKANKAFLKKKGMKIRRLASIDELQKLQFLLENNKDLIRDGGAKLSKIDYQLLVFPHTSLKPTQVDIVDGAAFLFSTTGKMVILTDAGTVESFAAHFTDLMNSLSKNYTLFHTFGKVGYSLAEIDNIIRVMKFMLLLQEPPAQFFDDLLKGHCDITDGAAFKKRFSDVKDWALPCWPNDGATSDPTSNLPSDPAAGKVS